MGDDADYLRRDPPASTLWVSGRSVIVVQDRTVEYLVKVEILPPLLRRHDHESFVYRVAEQRQESMIGFVLLRPEGDAAKVRWLVPSGPHLGDAGNRPGQPQVVVPDRYRDRPFTVLTRPIERCDEII